MNHTTPRPSTSRLKATLVATAAAAMAIGMTAVPAASAQPAQFLFPGSSFGSTLGPPCEAPELDPAGDEYRAQLAEATNAARVEEGRQPLRVNEGLTEVATDWSGVQAEQNNMQHNPNLRSEIPPGASRWSENVLQNIQCASPEQLVSQWLASPGHNFNLLRGDHTDVGVGVAVADDGRLYATQVFARY